MNLGFLLGLIKGKNIFDTVSKILIMASGFIAGADSNKTGNDDLLAGALAAVANGIDGYAVKDNNEHGNIVDGLIAGLTKYREEMVACGKITVVNTSGT